MTSLTSGANGRDVIMQTASSRGGEHGPHEQPLPGLGPPRHGHIEKASTSSRRSSGAGCGSAARDGLLSLVTGLGMIVTAPCW